MITAKKEYWYVYHVCFSIDRFYYFNSHKLTRFIWGGYILPTGLKMVVMNYIYFVIIQTLFNIYFRFWSSNYDFWSFTHLLLLHLQIQCEYTKEMAVNVWAPHNTKLLDGFTLNIPSPSLLYKPTYICKRWYIMLLLELSDVSYTYISWFMFVKMMD